MSQELIQMSRTEMERLRILHRVFDHVKCIGLDMRLYGFGTIYNGSYIAYEYQEHTNRFISKSQSLPFT